MLGHLDRDTEALEELRLARQIAPDYEAVWILEDSLLARQSNPATVGEREALRNEAAIRFPRSSRWQTTATKSGPEWTVLVGGSHENLSNDFDDWNHQFFELSRISAASGQLGARLGRDARGNSADLSLGLSVELSFVSDWFAGADISLADDPAFQPDTGFSLHAGKSLADGWVADLRYRRRDYATTSVGSVIGTVERYFGDFRLAYSLGVSKLDGASSFANHVATFNWYYRDDASIGITVNTGREAESIGNGQVLETDVNGLSLTGKTPLNDRFSLSWWLGVHDQGDLYRRQFLGLAISYRI